MKAEHSKAIVVIAVIVLLIMIIIMLKPQIGISASSGATGFSNPFSGMFAPPDNIPIIPVTTPTSPPVAPPAPAYNPNPDISHEMMNMPASMGPAYAN